MSEIQFVMKFELLPNEILIECFEYLNASDIFHSFDQLNYRFYRLIRTISLHLSCQYVRKSTFDQFCTKMLANPEIKTQIRSIHLSNKNTCASIKTFLSFFSLDEFSYLRSVTLTEVKKNNVEQLQSMLPLIPELTCFRSIDTENKIEEQLLVVLMPKLRTLSTRTLDSVLTSTHEILPIQNLTVSYCPLSEFYYLFQRIPMLQYLNVENIYKKYSSTNEDKCFTGNYAFYLKRLLIIEFIGEFADLTTLLKQMPNLKCLIIFGDNNRDMIDACRWEHFIISSLPQLTVFKFKFSSCHTDYILNQFKQFQSAFWQEQHHWYTEYTLYKDSADIYTIPYISNTYILIPHTNRYQNQLMNNINTFDNVSDLILYQKAIILKDLYYFSNVTSLTLENKLDFEDIDDHFLKIKDIHFLKMIVNLSNLKHLTISSICEIESSSVLLQLLKETIQLSSLTIELHRLRSLFNDNELCKYLNKIITRLDICKYPYESFDNSEEIKQFCKIFSNLEQLICYIKRDNDLLLLLIHLPKLSIMKIILSTLVDHECFTCWLEDEGRKLQLPMHIEFEHEFSQTLYIWIDKNIKTLNINSILI